jgi:hypothetical protein
MINQIIKISSIDYKECRSKIHQHKTRLVPLNLMGKLKRSKDGYSNKCKKCAIIEQRTSDSRGNRQRYKEKRRYREGMDKTLWRGCKDNAKIRGIEFNLDPEDIVVPDICPIFNIPLIKDVNYLKYNGRKNPMGVDEYPSIDRLDSTKGYIKNNINIISWKANNLKSNATLDDLEKLLKWVKSKYETQHLER